MEQSTNDVIHGSDRTQPASLVIHRTERARVSSIPNRLVSAGAGSNRVAATINALCAVGHDTPYSPATPDTARLLPAIESAN